MFPKVVSIFEFTIEYMCRFRNDFDDDDDPSSFESDLAMLVEMESEMKDSESQESIG